MTRQHTMFRKIVSRLLITFALLLVAVGVRAADYVLTYTSGTTTYYVARNGTSGVQRVSTFEPTTCIWSCSSNTVGTTAGTLNNSNTYGYLFQTVNGTRYFLAASADALALGTNASANNYYRWRTNGTYVYNRYSNNTSYYINLASGVARNTTANTASNARPYQVTITTVIDISTNPTINGDNVLTTTGFHNYTATGAVFRIGYKNYYFNGNDHYVDANGNSITPANAIIGTPTWNLTANDYAMVNGSGVVNVSSLPEDDITLTLTATVPVSGGMPVAPSGTTLTASKEITIQGTKPSAPIISVSGTTATISTDAAGSTTIRYTLDGTDPTATTGTVYSGAIDLSTSTTSPITIKAITVRNGNASDVSTEAVTLTLPAPTITVNGSAGTATISAMTGSTIYYTTDGSDPTTSSSQYSGSLSGLAAMTTITAIAVKDGWNDSPVASETVTIPSGVSGGTVTLFDYEDHNWSYYQASGNLPSGYPNELHSPDPRNVKITYRGVNETDSKPHLANGNAINNASAVAISALDGEGQNIMVYYKTLEKSVPGMTGDYPYTVISNPFSKRPATGTGNSKVYYGFAGWKVVSGGEYISEYANDAVLPLDATIHFTGLDTGYTPNCTSAEVVFEATWAEATVKTGNSAQTFTGGTYETNFWVLTGNPGAAVTVPANCTMTARYPDGTSSWTGDFTRAITAGGNNAKVEWVNMNSTGAISAANYTFTMGRGIVNSANGGDLQGCTSNANCVQTVKIESGTYATLHNFTSALTAARTCDQLMIMGCDYDRAKNDNSKLTIRGAMYIGTGIQLNRAANSLYTRTYIKSGNLGSTVTVSGNNNYTGAGGSQTYYYSVSNTHNAGRRYLCVEGGRLMGIAGGMDESNNQTVTARAFDLRVRGTAQIDGVVYGAAEYANARGVRTMVFTGGTVNGWVAGGANGTQNTNGALTGATYLYVGGRTNVDSNNSTQVLNRAIGGNIFGAGCGYSTTSSSGQVLTYNTNVVVADKSYIERGVYGGGSYGYTTNTSNLYVLGGHIGGENGGVSGTAYSANITGGVFGGACQNQGGTVNITMTDGLVEGGVYGGSNANGTVTGPVSMQINGGQVGTSSANANIHGGGYGQSTVVSGNVDLTLGVMNQTEPGVTVYGDVYGGSALGSVNGTSANTTYHTNVTLNAGTINGSLYGGALGSSSIAANVYSPVQVKVYGGSVKETSADGSGGVYGANNINGAPQRSVTVDIYGTDPAPDADSYALYSVYGGGNHADYLYGNGYPKVTVHNCDNSIEYVYGGGNAADVSSTDVKIYGGDKIGNVFGGGNGSVQAASVMGNTNVTIYGGTIGRVFGGSNTDGSIDGSINVNVVKQVDSDPEGSSTACPMHIDEVYGGGNMASSQAGNITIGCTGDEGEGIGDVYGGARAAEINGNIALNITGGSIERVFGGNNISGDVIGTIDVNIDWSTTEPCGYNYLGYVYGAGNKADYNYDSRGPIVNIKNGAITYDVFGGGLEAAVAGSVAVNMLGGSVLGDLYGGGALAHTNTSSGATTIVNLVGGTVNNVYGGGLGQKDGFNGATSDVEAYVYGDVTVKLNGSSETGATNDCKVTGNIFGCNNLNGSPKGHVLVHIYKTVGYDDTHKKSAGKDDTTYDVVAVYGGGNMAAYIPNNPESTTEATEVIIDGCDDTSIQYVYGGGNAASAPATNVTINGCYEIGYVFGGGNGKDDLPNGDPNPGANVGYYAYEYNGQTGEIISGTKVPYGTGKAKVDLLGGTIHNAFGGSNTKGNVRETAVAFLDEANDACHLSIDNIYGGGNEAYMEGRAEVQLGCITSMAVIYGGSKKADVGGDIELNITSGHFDRVFGGNNESGNIKGSITVNIEETGCHPITIGELYGCGNQAAYTTPAGKDEPTINVKSFTSIGRIFGGGLGAGAVVTGNPVVNINEVVGKNATETSTFAGTTITLPDNTTVTLPAHESGKIGAIGTVFGGGNAAAVTGNTSVNIGTEDNISYVSGNDHASKSVVGVNIVGNVYGGGNEAEVTGKTNVIVGKE